MILTERCQDGAEFSVNTDIDENAVAKLAEWRERHDAICSVARANADRVKREAEAAANAAQRAERLANRQSRQLRDAPGLAERQGS